MKIRKNIERYRKMTFEDLCNIFKRLQSHDFINTNECNEIKHALEYALDIEKKIIFVTTDKETNANFTFAFFINMDRLSCQINFKEYFPFYDSLTSESFEYMLKEKFLILEDE